MFSYIVGIAFFFLYRHPLFDDMNWRTKNEIVETNFYCISYLFINQLQPILTPRNKDSYKNQQTNKQTSKMIVDINNSPMLEKSNKEKRKEIAVPRQCHFSLFRYYR